MSRRALVVAAIWLAAPGLASAKTFEPTRKDDPPPGKCKRNNCSLREAVIAANNRNGDDVVRLGRGTYRLTIPEGPADMNDSSGGDLDLIDEVSLRGRSSRRTKISGEDATRILHPQGTLLDFSVKGLKIRNGIASGGVAGGDGGAILATNTDGELRLINVALQNNAAADNGGAIHSRAGELTIRRSTVSSNSATSGGGVYAPAVSTQDPKLTIQNSTISGNGASAGLGGGIYLDGANPGGAPEDPELTMVNSTVAENNAAVSGGGIAAILGSSADIDSTTIAYNGADSDSSGGGSGGGVFQSSGAIATVDASLVSDNTIGTTGTGRNCAEDAVGGISGVNNAVGDPGTDECGLEGAYGPDAGIDVLGNYGGPTKTVRLLTGSLAIGQVVQAGLCPVSDQRGKPRPSTGCDAGAFERKLP